MLTDQLAAGLERIYWSSWCAERYVCILVPVHALVQLITQTTPSETACPGGDRACLGCARCQHAVEVPDKRGAGGSGERGQKNGAEIGKDEEFCGE